MSGPDSVSTLLESVRAPAEAGARSLLAPLQEYDRKHGGDLVRTLQVYLQFGGNASASADALSLHRSGLLYRLRRIETLLGLRLDVFSYRVALELAVLLLVEEDPDLAC